MRRQPTKAEAVLWLGLRWRQIDGLKFRRQVPIGSFIADFFCPSARLVVEVDGITHAESWTDAGRDAWMRSQGLRVLRVEHKEVLFILEGVLAVIRAAAGNPSP